MTWNRPSIIFFLNSKSFDEFSLPMKQSIASSFFLTFSEILRTEKQLQSSKIAASSSFSNRSCPFNMIVKP
uniref:Uncharacterized protein n=1 Tax=Glycine max TaxID=3847 RepID=A0A0R0J190_SOYBN